MLRAVYPPTLRLCWFLGWIVVAALAACGSRRESAAGQDGRNTAEPGDSAGLDAGKDSGEPSDSGLPTDSGTARWRSTLYPEEWTPAFTAADGHFLHDFSYAGYHAGEIALPAAPGPHFDITVYGADATGIVDSTAAVAAAIAAASASPPAVVEFPAGTFRLDGALVIDTSGIVLHGQGAGATRVYFTTLAGMSDAAHITFRGALVTGAAFPLAADAEARSSDIQLSPNPELAIGSNVSIGWTITDEFVAEHEMTGVWYSFQGLRREFFRRTVVAVDAATGRVSLDVPTRYPAKVRDEASLNISTGYLTECGLEDLAISNVNDWDTAWITTRNHAILLSGVQDCWVRNVASWESPLSTDGRGRHLASGGIKVLDSRRVTVADTTLERPQHRGEGGNGYLYEVSRSNEILFRDDHATRGRHNFIQNWDFGTSGCVWLRTTSEGGRAFTSQVDAAGYSSYSEFHHSLAMANLIDASVATDGWQSVNRQGESSGAGHAATESVWWNTSGGGYLRSLQFANGYVIGTTGMGVHVDPSEVDWNNSGQGTAPEDWTEGIDQGGTLEPASLYEDQLRRRLDR